MGRWFRRQAGEEAGAVLVFVSIAMVALIGATALAVDIGQVTNNNRTLQASADDIALDAGRAVNGQTAAQLSGASGAVILAVQGSATRNNIPFSKLTVDLGTVSGNTFTNIATTVLNGALQTVASTSVPNAVRVTASGTVNFAFARGGKTTNRNAVASQTAITGISLGSFLARVSTSTGLLNSVLGRFLGAGADLTLVGYTGIAAGTVNLGQLQAQLGFGTVNQLLTANITLKNFLNATAAALNAKGDAASLTARAAVVSMASATNASLSLHLGDLIGVASGGGNSAAAADLNVLQLIEMAAEVANGTNALAVTLSPGSLGGLGGLLNAGGNSVSLKVIEAPQIVIGPAAQDAGGNWVTTVHTAQVRLMLHLAVAGLVDLPIYIEAASATASVRGITCATPVAGSTVNVHTDTQALRARIGVVNDINAANPTVSAATVLNVNVLGIPIASVNASSDAALSSSPSDLVFHGPFNWSNTKTVGSSSLGLGSLMQSNLSLVVNVLGLGVNVGALTATVLGLITPVLGAIDNGLLDPVLSGLGISLGGGDVTNWMIDCSPVKLR